MLTLKTHSLRKFSIDNSMSQLYTKSAGLEVANRAADVSILICVRNTEKYIHNCINSVLKQNFPNFEAIIIEEFDSIDRTEEIIKSFGDKRIRYFRNKTKLGISRSRNLSVNYSKGKYLFFTDGDCVVAKSWLDEGLKFLKEKNCVGVEGKSYTVSENYKPTFSDHAYGGQSGNYMTNNMAYKKAVVVEVGGFDERYDFHEDRDLALRIMKYGKIRFNPNMKVFVQQETLTPQSFLRRTNALRNRVLLFKKFGQKEHFMWRIVEPWSLMKVIFPALIFTSLFSKRFVKNEDFRLFPFQYIFLLFSRLKLWKESAKQRVFLI
jgi:glycosyltransferase involved in cell wall biosynthesis